MKGLSGFLPCILMIFIAASSAFATIGTNIAKGCVPYTTVDFHMPKPDVLIKEIDNGNGEATILVPFRNEDRSWWEFWKPAYVYKEAKIPTRDLPKQGKAWLQFWQVI